MTAPAPSPPAGTPARPALGAVGLRFESVSKVFPDGTRALEDVSFEVRKGEFVTIVGPSGCGKSTVLKIASGLIPKSSGTMELAEPNIGYVFQDATLLPWRTVRRNVELFCELHKMGKDERAKRAADAIRLVGLEGFEGHYPNALSGGMRMRVSLARSLTLNPEIFLFDEPFGALDEITRERMNDEVLNLFQIEQFAGLFITHSIYEAVYLSTRVLVMSARPGRIVAEFDVPFDYPRHPDLRYEAAFAEVAGEVSHALRGGYGT
jgi:NitT/TauT family transport system ATP-binding protein